MNNNTANKIGLFALIMLITSAVDNIRNLPATALFGTSLIFFFSFAAIIFLIPSSFVSAELSSTCPEESGIFHWARKAFGDKTGFLAIWLQWISNLVWFPTILSFIAGTAAFVFSPELAQNKIYLVSVILGTFWTITLINLKGLRVSAIFTSICTILGLVIPMVFIISLAIIWLASGKPIQIHFTAENMMPTLSNSQNWISLTAVMTSFLGMELSAVHIRNVINPQRTFPRAVLCSLIIILATMILGSLAIAMVLPVDQISLVNGLMQAFTNFFAAYHISWVMPIISVLIIIGSIGGIISWVISPAKGLLQAAEYGFLPAFFRKVNKHDVASNLLITQAVIVSLVCLAYFMMPSVNGSYWLLTALSTQLYILMYVIMFISGLVYRQKFGHLERGFSIPGGVWGLRLMCILGLFGCFITLMVGFIPPGNIDVGTAKHYEIIFTSGLLAMIFPAYLFILYRKCQGAKEDVALVKNTH